jgi:hypothetical protein
MNAKNVIFHLSVIIMTSLYGFQETTVSDIREALDEYISKHMQERMSDIRYIESFGIQKWGDENHIKLSMMVSNSFNVVFDNFSLCATNQVERYLLLSTGWPLGVDYYITFFDKVLDKYAANMVTDKEIKWYKEGHFSPILATAIISKYKEHSVSNLIEKIERLTFATNECEKIRSGEALREYIEFKKEIEARRIL